VVERALAPLSGKKLEAAQAAILKVYQSGQQMTSEQWVAAYEQAIAAVVGQRERGRGMKTSTSPPARRPPWRSGRARGGGEGAALHARRPPPSSSASAARARRGRTLDYAPR
jgi:hypothetical protein